MSVSSLTFTAGPTWSSYPSQSSEFLKQFKDSTFFTMSGKEFHGSTTLTDQKFCLVPPSIAVEPHLGALLSASSWPPPPWACTQLEPGGWVHIVSVGLQQVSYLSPLHVSTCSSLSWSSYVSAFKQGCIISPKDRSGGGDIMGTFEEPKGGPLDIGEEYWEITILDGERY